MQDLERQIDELKAQAGKICKEHNLAFFGVFQNTSKCYERTIFEGIEITHSTTTNDNNNKSTTNISSNSDVQSIIALFNQSRNENVPTNNDFTGSEINSSMNSILSSSSSSSASSSLINSTSNIREHSYKMINIDPHNKVNVKNFLYNCFEEFQQIPCKLLAKAWIKVIEPRKQSKYPYKNGKISKPFWWPPSCIHKEPDHLKKDERINLLIRIIRVFKQRKSELIYTASMINGLGPNKNNINDSKNLFNNTNNSINKDIDYFSKRKMDLLNDMFIIVEAEYKTDIKKIQVIKPGKKYSSQIYQKNKVLSSNNNSKKNSSNLIENSIKTPKRESSINFPTFSTPPSDKIRDPFFKTSPITLLPPLKENISNLNNDSYVAFLDYNNNNNSNNNNNIHHNHHNNNNVKIDIEKSNNSNFLGSPFTPLNHMNMKYPTPQYSNSNCVQSRSNQIYENINNSNSNNTNSNVIDPKFYENLLTPVTTKESSVTSQRILKPLSFDISPPTGTFTVNNNDNNNNGKKFNALSSLSPSRMNILNTNVNEQNKISDKKYLYSTFQVNEGNLTKGEINHNADDNDITDEEEEDDDVISIDNN
ncbi:Transmembrane 9 super member 3 [Pichia californica]|uniref:Transmembrane 9 super member 3 n=1 Tax=Pichia californica TaxID=460514 RepID=A0A9P6WQY7_9ASCO|nr:Transmembrane 9 super member 3 [[Candida] californica]KAG0690817.1 Transmembrane 9 super member 3 [[Candida] californica]